MTTAQQPNPIDALEQAFKEAIAYYEGPGATSKARVGDWGPKETLAHFIYFVNATAKGMEEVAGGRQPTPLYDAPISGDEMNARTVSRYADKPMSQVVAEARQGHERMVKAARTLSNLDAPVVIRPNGETQTARQRIDGTARHWLNHVSALKEAS